MNECGEAKNQRYPSSVLTFTSLHSGSLSSYIHSQPEGRIFVKLSIRSSWTPLTRRLVLDDNHISDEDIMQSKLDVRNYHPSEYVLCQHPSLPWSLWYKVIQPVHLSFGLSNSFFCQEVCQISSLPAYWGYIWCSGYSLPESPLPLHESDALRTHILSAAVIDIEVSWIRL